MGSEFWRTIQMAIEEDNWTARLVVVLFATAAAAIGAYVISVGR
ncbi:hypothetical protein [Streptomyces xantholiticus]|uniref:Integral membrane protein n=1 Tax=Streptomyces xantholiticus TaxID=68285 RepID=A0ABV1V1V4_9ACTN